MDGWMDGGESGVLLACTCLLFVRCLVACFGRKAWLVGSESNVNRYIQGRILLSSFLPSSSSSRSCMVLLTYLGTVSNCRAYLVVAVAVTVAVAVAGPTPGRQSRVWLPGA